MNKNLKSLLSKKRHVDTESLQDTAQQKYYSLENEIQRMNLLKSLPQTDATKMQINDLQRQIGATMNYLKNTGQSYDYTKNQQDSVIKQAEYLKAQDFLQDDKHKHHKLVDLVDEQKIQDDYVTKQNNQRIAIDLLKSIQNPISDDILLHNIQALIRDQLLNEHGITDQMIQGKSDGVSDRLIQYEQHIDPETSKDDMLKNIEAEKKIIDKATSHDEPKKTVTLTENNIQEELADKISKHPQNQDEMKLYLEEHKYLNSKGKIKSKASIRELKKKIDNKDSRKLLKNFMK